jgi:hypothetical protein
MNISKIWIWWLVLSRVLLVTTNLEPLIRTFLMEKRQKGMCTQTRFHVIRIVECWAWQSKQLQPHLSPR